MKLMSAVLIGAMMSTVPALADPAKAQSASTCASLSDEWDRIEKNMAVNMSQDITDNSAPRATLRNLEDLNGIDTAHFIYDMMKDNKCALPKMPPLPRTYFSAALACDTEVMKQRTRDVPECKYENWEKSE